MNGDIESDLDKLIALRLEKLREARYSYDDLLMVAVNCWILADLHKNAPIETKISLPLSDVCSKIVPDVVSKSVAATKSYSANTAINARHNKPGGSRENKSKLLEKWASGQYSTRDCCASEWAEKFGMKESTARRALQGTKDPHPWPAKKS